MQRAVNPDTGEVLYLVNNQWVPPAKVATNPDTGAIAHLVGNEWQVMPAAKPSSDLPALDSNLKGSVLAGTKLPTDAPPMGNRMLTEVGQAPIPALKDLPKFDTSKMPTAEDRAVAQFGITPEMGIGEKALRTAKGSLYGASTGLQQTWLGGARMISDITGLGQEGVKGVSKQLSKEQQAVEKTYAPEYGFKIAKDIGSSVVQTLPTLGVGLYAGQMPALASMFTQSFMQTYDDSRNEGLGVGASTARSALYGTAEALGESLGLPNLLKSAKAALKGVPTADLAKEMSKYILKEIPGEQFTYVAQFLTDKGFGLNPEAGMKEFLQGAQDTALVTVGQTAVMGGAGFTTNKVLKELRSLHSKGEEGIPKAADMMKQAGFSFEPKATTAQAAQQVQPQEVVQPTVTPSVTPRSGAIQPEDIEEEVVQPPAQVAPAAKPTFDEWRTQQGLMFGSKEEYQAALPKLQAQYEAEMTGAPVAQAPAIPAQPAKTEAPKFAQDETGEKLTYPMFADLAQKGYQLHSFDNPRTYQNKGGVKYRTLEKDGVRIALEPQQVLFTDPKKPNQQPQLGMGNENDVAFHFLGVDPELRRQGKASEALQDLVDVADQNGYTLYGEPAELEKKGITKDQLIDLYSNYGFNLDDSGKVIVREPKPVYEAEPLTEEDAKVTEKARNVYKKILADNPDIDEKFKEGLQEEVDDPNRYHPTYEEPNSKNLKIGDTVYEKGDPVPKYVVSIIGDRDEAKLVDSKGESYGGWSDISDISTKPVDYDYKFDFGFGPVNVNVNKWLSYDDEWQFSMYGEGASETGFRSVLGIRFDGKPGTKEFAEFVERVAKANALDKAPKPKKPTKEEKVAANKTRQAEKKAKATKPKVVEEEEAVPEFDPKLGIPALKNRLDKNININIVSSKDGKDWYASGQRVRDTRYLVKLDLTTAELKKAQEIESELMDYMVGTDARSDMQDKLSKHLTPAAKRAIGYVEEEKPKTQAEINKERQAEKKAKAEKPVKKVQGPVDTSAVNDLIEGRIKKVLGWTIYKRKEDPDFWYVQSPENHAENKIGPGDDVSTNLDTARARIEQHIADAEYEARKAAEKPVEKKAEPKAVKEAKPATEANIAKAVAKAGETVDYAKMKKAAENQVDQAIKRTEYLTQKAYDDAKIPEDKRHVVIKIEGDGTFKIMNNKERLEEFKKKLANAIKPKQAGLPRREWESAAVGFKAESAFKNFLNDQEPDTAVAIANLTGLDISKVVLNPTQRKVLDRFIAEQKESGGNEPMAETIRSKPGANIGRMATMLGPQLYGSMKDITPVSVKEMIQNSFDAIKGMIEKGQLKKGNITIDMNSARRTIEMKDNGSGMSPETLASTFLTIAGTQKDTEFGSGGFGIAKMLFLFGNEDVEVTTMHNGKISHMETTGPQLMAALEDPSQAPDIEVMTPEQYGERELAKDFPDGHGTIVTIKVPATYIDQSNGKTEDIRFSDSLYSNPVLQLSPLFADIDVTLNGDKLDIGSEFPADEYTTFVNAKFKWGTARIYVSKEENAKHGENLHVLSNGLWQFSNKLGKKPGAMFSDNIPYTFYVDIVSKVKPDEAGYPFTLNRKGFSNEAGKDLGLIQKYLWLHYMQKDFASTKTSFGNVEYVTKRNGKIETSPKESLNPEVQQSEIKDKIDEGSKVEVKDGKLIVNGKEIPELSQEDLEKADINMDELKIDQDKVDPNKVMIHDNLEVNFNDDAIRKAAIDKRQSDIISEEDALKREKESLSAINLIGKKKIDDKIEELDKEFHRLTMEGLNLNPREQFTSITEAARYKFGDERFNSFMYDIGDVFMALRDRIVYLNKIGKLPSHKNWKGETSYADLGKEAIGISFDKEYRGVSIKLPFSGLFINPAFPEFIDTPEMAAYGLFGTMIHELAHYQVRSHDADFPAEMQRLTLHLKSDKDFDLASLEKALVDTVSDNRDILEYLNKIGSQNDSRSIGQRFKDGSFEGTAERTPEDMAKSGGEGQPGRGIPSELRPRYQAIGKEQQPKSVQTKAEAAREVDELVQKHNRSDTPLHPSGTVSDAFMGSVQTAKKIGTYVKENPTLVVPNMVGKTDRAMTYMRNKSVWYGTGLESSDFSKYNGQLRDSHGTAVASIAVTNAIHAGHVGTQVMIQGKLKFDSKLQMFVAQKSDKSMANVIKLKAELAKKLGAQTANNLINGYFEAKRSRSIVNEYLNREAAYENAIESGEDEETAAKNLKNIEVARQKVNMSDEEMDDFINMEKKYPELRKMMDNWTAVNHNMIDNMKLSGIISNKRAEQLKAIEDYVPWYRIMDNQSDIHQPSGGVVRTLTHVGKEKTFKKGTTDRDIDDIVDNMIHNVMMMTRNSMRNYAANRVALEYGTKKENGKLKVFPQEDHANGIFNILAAGRRINVQIADPLVAEAVIGMENVNIPMFKMMEAFTGTTANILRRTITTNPVFQIKQVFKDAPTAAWVSGMRNPFPIWGDTLASFFSALNPKDPIVQKLKAAGIGGFQSTARSPEKELKLEIGLLNHSSVAKVLKLLDHIGDASDYAQRRAIYKRVLAKTKTDKDGAFPDGDEMQALIQANNVIDFLKRGSSGTAQFLSRNVAFMNAYAQQIDVLAQTLAGGGLKGRSRKEALKNMGILGGTLALTSLMYVIAVAADPDYQELDDDTKIRNIFIPKSLTKFVGMDRAMILPMNTSASFFFKSMPELLYNKVMNEGTKFEVDNTRLRKSIKNAMVDSLLGPNPVPTGVKPFVEIGLNRNFFTGGNVTPKGMEKLDAAEQYNANTSELGKTLSGLMNGALNPMEADHLMRSLGGSVSAMAMWGSNMLSSDRPADELKQMPIIGQFVLKDVPRGAEDLFYDFKERSDKKYNTWNKLMERDKFDEADRYLDKNEGLISAHDYVTAMDADLKEVNKQIRTIGEVKDKTYNPKEKRADITDLQKLKLEMLEDIRRERKESGL